MIHIRMTLAAFHALFERDDLAFSQGLRAQALEMLAAFAQSLEARYKEVFLSKETLFGIDAYDLRMRASKWHTFDYNGIHWIFSTPARHSTEKLNGEFRPPNIIIINDARFMDLLELNDAGRNFVWRKTNPEHGGATRSREDKRNARLWITQVIAGLHEPDFLNTIIHELTHFRDHALHPMDKRSAKANATLTKHRISPGSPGYNKVYMASNHEYNAHFTAALDYAITSTRKSGLSSIDEFKAEFFRHYGKNHWALTPREFQQKALSRLYQAWVETHRA